jgi:hypothetical protein
MHMPKNGSQNGKKRKNGYRDSNMRKMSRGELNLLLQCEMMFPDTETKKSKKRWKKRVRKAKALLAEKDKNNIWA